LTDWDESEHPRDPEGQFTEKWVGEVARRLPGGGARDLLADPATDWAVLGAPGEMGSPLRWVAPMHRIYETQGFHARPRAVDRQEFRRQVAAGATDLWRGFEGGPTEMRDFVEGRHHFVGGGLSGQGTYATTQKARAAGYGRLVHMALAPGARVAKVADIGRLRDAEKAKGGDRGQVLSDLGRLAAAMGYDAMEIIDGDILVFNRGALIVEQP
jgi:hypothetical protein